MRAPHPRLPVLLAAVGYQFLTGPGHFVHDTLGVGRVVESVNNQRCHQIPELQACEDMWLHQETGLLYMTCGEPLKRQKWLPAVGHLDHLNKPDDEYLAILDTRASGPVASRITRVKPRGFKGTFNLHGFDIWETPSASSEVKSTFNIFLVNHRAPFDPDTGEPQQADFVGANSTVELFESAAGEGSMRHVRTYAHKQIRTPNRPAAAGPDSFVYSNDHTRKTGLSREFDLLIPSDISYCDPTECHKLERIAMPNGVVRSRTKPNQFFVASSSDPYVRLYELQADKTTVLLDKIYTGYPADNLSTDAEGNVYVAVFPKALPILGKYFKDPLNSVIPSAILKISPNTDQDRFYGKKFKVTKLFEDSGEIFTGATVGVVDSQNKKLFIGGVLSPYIVECQL
ncbi:related to serum paraoxonase/arylesterase [Pseudozyma flocculosa]|uniref:Related to serum paraoxonase/arylesterase n=1 Tax=Pseudozyma flocculosa TaxID=84751 RepID=A0A5C3EVB5_9BASI|nr:related to serum paraoxonase/arylesterase [Pseudozyma flocculosa]